MDYVEMYAWLVILLVIAFCCGFELGRQNMKPKRDEKGRFRQ